MYKQLCEKIEMKPRLRMLIVVGFIMLICVLVLKMSIKIDANIEQAGLGIANVYTKLKSASLDFLLAQVSMTFISISVMSVLSENNLMIYWENIVKRRLIFPIFSCFSSLTIYAFVIMFFSFLSFFLECTIGIFVFFILAIVDLMVLTSIMIRVYYGRDVRKKQLEKEYYNMLPQQKRECLDKLQACTILAYESKEYEKLMENCYFYGRHTSFLELRFLYDRLFEEERITSFECNMFEKIHEGLLHKFSYECKKTKGEYREIDKIVKKVNPLVNNCVNSYYRRYIYRQDECSEKTFSRLELEMQIAGFIGELYVAIFNRQFEDVLSEIGDQLSIARMSLDDEALLDDDVSRKIYIEKMKQNKKIIERIWNRDTDYKKRITEYMKYVVDLFKRKEEDVVASETSDIDSNFGIALFLVLVQLGFLSKEVNSNDVKVLLRAMTKDDYEVYNKLLRVIIESDKTVEIPGVSIKFASNEILSGESGKSIVGEAFNLY